MVDKVYIKKIGDMVRLPMRNYRPKFKWSGCKHL